MVNYSAHHLSASLSDDELIAGAIEYQSVHSARVLVVTADLGLRMKLPAHKIECVSPLESDRLADEPDDSEKELIELRRELVRYQSRIPKLSLTFAGGKTFSSIKLLEPPEGPAARTSVYGFSVGEPSDEAYLNYYSEFTKWKDEIVQYFPCELLLENSGSAEATKVHVDLILPEFMRCYAKDDLPDKPKSPRSLFESDDFGHLASFHSLNSPRPAGKPYIGDLDNSVSWIAPSLVHGRVLTLHTFYLRFSNSPVRSFSFEFLIASADIIDAAKGKLSFVAD